jgi:cell division protein FtsL
VTPRRAPRRGRTWVALVLVGFVVLASAVIWRRAIGLRQADALRTLETRRAELDGEKVKLESQIRMLSSREHLGPIAEQRLHMRVPDDSQVIVLPHDAH